jgi:uncharacterized LabA/DUF88 family protein
MRNIRAIEFQKAMVFVDGTNLFNRLESAKLRLTINLVELTKLYLADRQLVRTYLYTVDQNLNKAKSVHGELVTKGVRVVLGDGIPTSDGNIKEKGVDALLVADLVYHAAVKNFDFALVVTLDTDFVHAIKRASDFGCRIGVLAICAQIPERLRTVADETIELSIEDMIRSDWAKRI